MFHRAAAEQFDQRSSFEAGAENITVEKGIMNKSRKFLSRSYSETRAKTVQCTCKSFFYLANTKGEYDHSAYADYMQTHV